MKPMAPMAPMKPLDFGPAWWPKDLGEPSTRGAQDDLRYAVFPERHRLAIQRDAKVTLYDSGDHRIGGVAQAQGGTASLAFTSQHGDVALDSLKRIG